MPKKDLLLVMFVRSLKVLTLTFIFLGKSSFALDEDINTKPILIAGSTSVTELLTPLKDDISLALGNTLQIRPMGSDKGVKAIAAGLIDIGTTSRYLTKQEQEQWPHLRQIVIAQDALTFIVNSELNIKNLSITTLKNIYQGKITKWSDASQLTPELSNKNDEILLFSKATHHGSFDVFLEFLELDYIKDPESNFIRLKNAGNRGLFSNQKVELYNQFNQALGIVQRIPNAIAYDSYGAISNLENDRRINKVTTLSINGVKPNLQSISDGEYAFVRPLILIVNTQSPRSKEIGVKLAALFKSQKVKDKIREHGYLPVQF